MAGAVRGRGFPGAVVADLELECCLRVTDDDRCLRPPRVLECVRQRLLHDPIGGQVDPRWQRRLLTLDPQLDWQAGLAHLLDERAERAEPRLGPDRQLLVAGAQDSQQPAQFDQRLTTARLDRAENASCLLHIVEQARPRLRLDDHHADAVRDHVVKLAGDSPALLGHGHARLLLPLALQARRTLAQQGELTATAAQVAADQPGDREDEPGGGTCALC